MTADLPEAANHALRAFGAIDYRRRMGKRSGIPHTDEELAELSRTELEAELQRSKMRLTIAGSAKMAKQWHKRIHWIEGAMAKLD